MSARPFRWPAPLFPRDGSAPAPRPRPKPKRTCRAR